ncbi:sensor histidine kinase [Streptomyces montanus]|uniref:histidine kinase n=1 Tax=Streptomyces montanus TaxID=2580423 RepID=A0A5R9G018_9ACTN|nr:sensor histidine kinase [Streptomyces montanus]TLS44985.1 sensor histidine kinase [Streptomyces montanus]
MTLSLERYTDRHPRAADSAAAFVLFIFAVLGASLTIPDVERPHQLLPAVLLAAVSCIALLRHRDYPRTTVIITTVCAMAASGMGYMLNPLLLAPVMAALYWLAALTDRRTARAYLLVTVFLLVSNAVITDRLAYPLVLKTLAPTIWVLLPVVAGSAARLRISYMEAVQARADHAERTREEEARLRVAEERMRIARELHDVVAHHLALANAQAGTAAHLSRTHPDRVPQILDDLSGTTSSALRELKATVGLMRQANDPDAPLEPAPGLARLPELTDACRTAGLEVTVTTEGIPRPLSPGVDLTAFRIVQEALTNVTKHAAAKAANVRLAYSHDRLTVTVCDDGTTTVPATPSPGRGFGLIGMRERAHSVGGDLQAGHRPQGGFEVTTQLPLHTHPKEPEEQITWPSASCSPTTKPSSEPPSGSS